MKHTYKICIYAICKNEEQFVDRWVEPAKEADLIVVTDTGSTDNTIEKLKSHGVQVHSLKIDPFRFDKSRNFCLSHIPEDIDICISLDLDEIIQPGWRESIEKAWTPDTTLGRYLFNWSLQDDGTPEVQYYYDRIHARKGFHWIYPTHEILEYMGEKPEKQTFIPGLVVNHYPDRAKNRSFNLPLLELAVQEYGDSARNLHYLGREYLYAGQWQNCIDTLKKYLSPSMSSWDEERSASMRFIARSYGMLNNPVEQKRWLFRAMGETPFLREPYVEMAQLAYSQQDWNALYFYALEALKITTKSFGYANEIFAWDSTPYDFAAIACYYLGQYQQAVSYSEHALKAAPNNERLLENHKIYLQAI